MPPQDPVPAIPRVVLLAVDGLAAPELLASIADQPTESYIQRYLLSKGSWTDRARAQFPTVSYPNWASILWSASVPFHGVDGNEWERAHPQVVSVEGPCSYFPSLFQVLKRFVPSAPMGAFYEWDTIGEIVSPLNGTGIQKTQTHGDDESTDAAIEFLRTENPLLTLVYLEEIDEVGHKYGFGDEYRQAIRRVDGRIGRILHALEDMNQLEETLLVLVTDHGRKAPRGQYHGSFTNLEMNTVWAIRGPGIRSNHYLQSPLATLDTSTLVLTLLGYQPPVQWQGRPLWELMTSSWLTARHQEEQKHHRAWLRLPPSLQPDEQIVALSSRSLEEPTTNSVRFKWWPRKGHNQESPDQRTNQTQVSLQDTLSIGHQWKYQERHLNPETVQQCLREFSLRESRLYGNYDLASFLMGVSLGIWVMLVVVGGGLCVWKRWVHRRSGGGKGYSPLN